MKRILFPLIVLFLALACNLPAPNSPPQPFVTNPPGPQSTLSALLTAIPTSTPPPIPSDTPTPPLPTDTPTVTPTSTPAVPLVAPKDQPVNCRYGPGAEWLAVSALKLETTAEVVGRNTSSTWWYIKDPLHPGAFCWVSAAVTNLSGNASDLSLIPPPEAQVIAVEVSVDIGGGVCPGPIFVSFNGSISTNGPTTVTYRWEVRGDANVTSPEETKVFTKADTWTFTAPGGVHLDCGSYRIILHVLTPNDIRSEKRFDLP